MAERKDAPAELINPNLIMREALDQFAEEVEEETTPADAKRIALRYGMLSVTEHILGGERSSNSEDTLAEYDYALKWLKAVKQTYEGDWDPLTKLLEAEAFTAGSGKVGCKEGTPEAIWKAIDIIKSDE